MTPVFGICGWKNSGKTMMTARLVRELTGRGYRVSTVKHAHHAFDIDREGADSHKHRMAGASEVAIVSRKRWALMHELRGEDEPALDEILARLSPCDIVLIEGYKREAYPKIEMRGETGRGGPLSPEDAHICAIACDEGLPGEKLPVFHREDVAQIADFVIATLGLPVKGRSDAAAAS